ncbi:MAG: ribonuclease P protein component [Phycisphaerae bacterium]
MDKPSPQKKYRLNRRLRLRRRPEISRAFEQGARVVDNRISLQGVRRETGQPTRCGVAVSKRHGNAVKRNRLKRICREAFRLARPDLSDGWDLVILPRAGREITVDGVGQSLRKLLPRLEHRLPRQEEPEQ